MDNRGDHSQELTGRQTIKWIDLQQTDRLADGLIGGQVNGLSYGMIQCDK